MNCRRAITLLSLLRWLLVLGAAAGLIRCVVVTAFSVIANRLQLAAAVEAGDTRSVAVLLDHAADPSVVSG
jgi:hypothetical protein